MVKISLLGRTTKDSGVGTQTFGDILGQSQGNWDGWLVTLLLGDSTLSFEYASNTGKFRKETEYAGKQLKFPI
jgi:hypothetical protein